VATGGRFASDMIVMDFETGEVTEVAGLDTRTDDRGKLLVGPLAGTWVLGHPGLFSAGSTFASADTSTSASSLKPPPAFASASNVTPSSSSICFGTKMISSSLRSSTALRSSFRSCAIASDNDMDIFRFLPKTQV